jgi:hypothetical protein
VGLVDTKLSGTKTVFDTIRLSGGGSGATAMYDDLYLSTGASCAFKGDPNLPPACTDVLTEPFNNFTDNAWDIAGAATIVAGRTGTAAQVSGGVSARATYTIAAPKQSDVITVGMAFRWTDASSLVRAITYLYGNGVTQVHVGLRVETTGALTVTRSTSTALVTSAAGIMVSNTWYYVEIQTKAHATAGTAIVRVNGTEVINATGLNTYTPTGPVLFDGVRVAPNVSGSVHLYDDLYISTGAGCAFKGDPAPPTTALMEPFNNFTDNAWVLTNAPTIVAGRTGTAAQLTTVVGLTRTVAVAQESDIFICGFALRIVDTNTGSFTRDLIEFRSDANAITHNKIRLNLSNQLIVTRGTSTAVGTSAAGLLASGTWYYIELRCKLHDTLGEATVRINGTEVINVTGVDTRNGGTKAVYDTISMNTLSASAVHEYDDLYLSYGASATFKGSITIP